ncbi:tRNA(Arg) A34 adenosine deaminase TadA (TadA) (PDB:2A8N) [Commensalibacter papalotli (ex Botero et al. 2024)]|uniref:tRNA-specific adenosine deaminase n=2 Tax=Commensalibacter papalotli (ex Botero et al. 2024) TaxID=2972766 RepID=A0ABN8WCA1_9PROT|nr:tRNA(Arg) A34 adenosine deaminase TadA (TadA) (PDB:2A8N) [Commensalibacter papalotli (ex Botero et al. 2024)]CAI3947989.1 tRNA(Arg) A34 adenosine deaminase TadA (TadA) (PDB:2A8N) [Commensalibacter papalotli (ex Botero et al. 2024)]
MQSISSYWRMDQALKLANKAFNKGEVPVGALVLSSDRQIISQAFNQVEQLQDPTAHAEMLALKEACAILNKKRLVGYTLVVNLEPCPMCAAAAMHYRVERIVFGAYDPKGGGIDHGACLFSHRQTLHCPEIIAGVREQESQKLLRFFFQSLR